MWGTPIVFWYFCVMQCQTLDSVVLTLFMIIRVSMSVSLIGSWAVLETKSVAKKLLPAPRSLDSCVMATIEHMRFGRLLQSHQTELLCGSLVPRSSTPNVVEGLVKLLRRMTSGGRLEAWLIAPCMHNTAVHRKYHTSRRPPDVTSFYVGVLPGLPPR